MTASAFALDRICAESFVRRVEYHAALPSTNDRGLELAVQQSLETPLLVLAAEQSTGRGRGVNRWWSGLGALTFSLILDAELTRLTMDQWPRIALTAGVAVCDVLARHLPEAPCGLKWPNDVLLAGRKVCGILVEVPPPPAPRRLVLGMGINVNNSVASAPEEIVGRAASLCDVAGRPFDATEFLVEVLNRVSANLTALAASEPCLAETWQRLCTLRGDLVEIVAGNRRVRGRCRGIDDEGALLLEVNDRVERFFGGTVMTHAFEAIRKESSEL